MNACWRLAILLLSMAAAPAWAAAPEAVTIDEAEAVRSGWDAQAPPREGWETVSLMDVWTARWPHHDGVVWYRMRWHQETAGVPVGLLIDYVSLADAVYVNGTLVHRDPSLVEPLSRSWIAPQYILLAAPLLHPGENTVLVRVSGLAAYQPGFGRVVVGEPQAVFAQYQADGWLRQRLPFYNHAVDLALGGVFLLLWLFWRRDGSYGWYALSALAFAAWNWNYLASSPWPFRDTHAFQAWNAVFYIVATAAFVVFLLRYCGRRWPRAEGVLWLFVLACVLAAVLAPATFGPMRGVPGVVMIALSWSATLAFLWHAVRSRRLDQRVLAACLAAPLLVSVHDVLLFFGVLRGSHYLSMLASPLTVIGMGIALAWRYAAAMRRVEGFNAELRHEVGAATGKLRDTLAREHALALAHTRAGERLKLVRDLHDGFGGSLLGAIAELEQPPASPEADRAAATLKQLREDLRLVIDTTTHEQDGNLADLLVALRHRWSQRLEAAGIDSRWRLDGLDALHLGPAHSLDVLRFVQEALTNVLKHSGAGRVDIDLVRAGDSLRVAVCDDGSGTVSERAPNAGGAGLASLRVRAARLGGELVLDSAPGRGFALRLKVSLPDPAA